MIVEIQAALCINNQTKEEKEISFNEMNKYVAYSNKDYTLILKYVKALEEQISGKSNSHDLLRHELLKAINAKKLLDDALAERLY